MPQAYPIPKAPEPKAPGPRQPDADATFLTAADPQFDLVALSKQDFVRQFKHPDFTRPQWSKAELPFVILEPVPVEAAPVRAGDFLLWPDVESQRCWFARTTPALLGVSLTAQVTTGADHNERITGGSALLTATVYAQETTQTIDRCRQAWTEALRVAGYELKPKPPPKPTVAKPAVSAGALKPKVDEYVLIDPQPKVPFGGHLGDLYQQPDAWIFLLPPAWKFLPQDLRDLSGTLQLPAGHTLRSPQVTANSGTGAVTFLVDLTELGVLTWKNAFEQRNGGSIPGVCQITASYCGKTSNQVAVRSHELSAPLGVLLAACGPQDVHVVNPQRTVDCRLLVTGHDLITGAVVAAVPSAGNQAPASQVFGKEGGLLTLTVTTQDVASIKVDWHADVSFQGVGWPVVPATGQLCQENGWNEMLKPDSWVATFTFMAILVDENGQAAPLSTAGSDYHVNGILTFTAPYIPVTKALVSPFDAANQTPVSVALPRFPGQPFGQLLLNLFATRGGRAGTQTRALAETDFFVVALVYPDAHVVIKTAADSLPERSTPSTMLGILARLGQAAGRPPRS